MGRRDGTRESLQEMPLRNPPFQISIISIRFIEAASNVLNVTSNWFLGHARARNASQYSSPEPESAGTCAAGRRPALARRDYLLLLSLFHIQCVASHWPLGCLRSTPRNLPESAIGSSSSSKV